MPDNIDIRSECGCVLVTALDDANQHHRWWFEPTPEGDKLVFISEVIDFEHEESEYTGIDGRHYVPEEKAEVPAVVADVMTDDGITVLDTEGGVLHE